MSEKATAEFPGIAATVRKHCPQIPLTANETATEVNVNVAPAHFISLVNELKTRKDLGFDLLRNITGIDMEEEGLVAKYNFYSIRNRHAIQVTVATPPGNPTIPSLTSIYKAADWHEREAAEMVGLKFEGHPNPKNLLLEEDLRIHPLLKAHPLQKQEILQGIEDSRPGFDF
jgi:NADH-quinone oxidoreductase subunit C